MSRLPSNQCALRGESSTTKYYLSLEIGDREVIGEVDIQ